MIDKGVPEAPRTRKASPFHLATQVFISSLVQRSKGLDTPLPLAHR